MTKQNLKKWEILSSNYLVKNNWCTVRKDHVRLPNGFEIPDYYVLEYPDWVTIIAITKQQEFLLVRQYRHGLQQCDYELVAGMCDDGDASPLDTAKRELLEESGYGNGQWEHLTVISANPSTHTNLCHCFLATDVEKIDSQHLDETEELEVVKLSLQEVKQLLLDDHIKQAMHAAPLWKYIALHNL